jgi:hypothetical protein
MLVVACRADRRRSNAVSMHSLVLYSAEDGSGVSDGFEGSKTAMLDIGMIAIGVGFFVVSILYVFACERT